MRGLIVGVLYAAAACALIAAFAVGVDVLVPVSFSLMAVAGAIFLRGEKLNARECERRRRTGWRLQADIERLERELGIDGGAGGPLSASPGRRVAPNGVEVDPTTGESFPDAHGATQSLGGDA